MNSKIKRALARVQKPGRYAGGEFGSADACEKADALRFVLCFPDTYEIGMSHLGLRILYGLVNSRRDWLCERVFAPWTDMEQEMRREEIPLFSLETHRPVSECQILGFTLQYELSYSNILNVLDLSGLPLRADERQGFPLVIAGGPCACNPEPLADFIDLFVLGEGEEILPELLELYTKLDWKNDKTAFLTAAAQIEGIYVPSLYSIDYKPDGTVKAINRRGENDFQRPKKRFVKNLDGMFTPENVIVPYLETIHDRATQEIFRGCSRGCRFCQAGYIYRPIREKSPQLLDEQCRIQCAVSGYDELSLCSLSTSDYTRLPQLLERLLDWTQDDKTNLSLPSLRMDNFPQDLMERIQSVRRSSLTFAPEAGTQRLRNVINKNISDEEILTTARQAFAGGWTAVKLYFMMGLPTETPDDIAGIARLAQAVVDEYYRNPNKPKGKAVRVNLSCACFVPKPFTPFQWAAQASLDELEQKQKLLRDSLTTRKVNIGRHNAKMGLLEGAFARGDRRLGAVLEYAFRAGSRFESWDEHFNFDRWLDAFSAAGLDITFYANRQREYTEILPWSHLDYGISTAFLERENQRALAGETTANCREKCAACGYKCSKQPAVSAQQAVSENAVATSLPPEPSLLNTPCPVRIWFSKAGKAIYISHLDMNRLMSRAVRRAGLPLWYTEGFNPHPYMTFALPLPLGQAGEREPVDIRLVEEMSFEELKAALNRVLPEDVQVVDVTVPIKKAREISLASYRIDFHCGDEKQALELLEQVSGPLENGELLAEKRSKRGTKQVNLCDFVHSFAIEREKSTLTLNCVLDAGNTKNLNAALLAGALLCGIDIEVDIRRLGLFCGSEEFE